MVNLQSLNRKSSASLYKFRTITPRAGLGGGKPRTKSTINRLQMYRSGKAIRNKDGKIVGGTYMMNNKSGDKPIESIVRIEPDRQWFGNTRTISTTQLDKFREAMRLKTSDPYNIVIKRRSVPMQLLQDPQTGSKIDILQSEPFDNIMHRKRHKLTAGCESLLSYAENAASVSQSFDQQVSDAGNDNNDDDDDNGKKSNQDQPKLFAKGQSKRIWGELYKVLDCSDVILQVIDARNVPGTRCHHVESYVKKHARQKHMVIILNKCDLVPAWCTRRWIQILSSEYPCIAFHASLTNSFGKSALIGLLRQFSRLHSDKKQISVGCIGYPNVGKSSVINTLKGKASCLTAPIPGITKIWQYVMLMKRVFLIDSPGIVYAHDSTKKMMNDDDDVVVCSKDKDVDSVLKGVVRAERLLDPCEFIPDIMKRVKVDHLENCYSLTDIKLDDATDFLERLATRSGRLLKGGECDLKSVAIQVINDFQRGKLPHFVPPPNIDKNTVMQEEEEEVKQPDDDVNDDDDEVGEKRMLEEEEDCHIDEDGDGVALKETKTRKRRRLKLREVGKLEAANVVENESFSW